MNNNKQLNIENLFNIDKIVLTLIQSTWIIEDRPSEKITLTITKDCLKINKTIKYNNYEIDRCNNLKEHTYQWKILICEKDFDLVLTVIKKSFFINIHLCDAIPANAKCYLNNQKILQCDFDENDSMFYSFLKNVLSKEIITELFGEDF